MLNRSIIYMLTMIALCHFLLFYKYLLQIFPSIMTSHLMQQFHLSGEGLGNLSACFFYGYAFTQLYAGFLVDKFGLKKMASCATLIASGGMGLFAWSSHIYPAMIARCLMGCGGAFATICYLRCTEGWCQPKYRSLADGSLTLGVMLGAFCAEAPLALLIEKYSLQFSFQLMFIAGLFLTLIIFIFLKDGDYLPKVSKKFLIKPFWLMLCRKDNWLLAAYSGLAFAPLAVFGGLWGTPFIQEADHFSKPIASGIVSLAYIGFGLGGPLFGYLASRYQNKIKLMALGLMVSFVALLMIIYMPIANKIFLASCMILLGLGTGGFMLGFSLGKAINQIFLAGSIVALINSGDALLGAFTEPFIGKLLDWGYDGKAMIAPIFTLKDYHHALSLLLVYLTLAGYFLYRFNKSYMESSFVVKK